MSDEPTRGLTAEERQQYHDLIEARGYDRAPGLALWPEWERKLPSLHRDKRGASPNAFEAFAEKVERIYGGLTGYPLAHKVGISLQYEVFGQEGAAFLAWRMRNAEEEIRRLYLELVRSYVDEAGRVRPEALSTLRAMRDRLEEEVRRNGEQNRKHVERCQRGLLALWAEKLVSATREISKNPRLTIKGQQLYDAAYGFHGLAQAIAEGCSLEWFVRELDRECRLHPAAPFFIISQRAGLLEEAKKVADVVERAVPLEQQRRAVEKLIEIFGRRADDERPD